MNRCYLLIFFVSIIGSCDNQKTEPSDACFSNTSDNEYLLGSIISFNNCSTHANFYIWDFGDESSSHDENPTHTYSSSGIYKVTLNAQPDPFEDINSDGKIDSTDLDQTVGDKITKEIIIYE